MKTIELIINGILILGGLLLLVVTIRYPRTVFVDIPLAIIKFPFRVITLFVAFGIDLFDYLIYLVNAAKSYPGYNVKKEGQGLGIYTHTFYK